LLIILSVGYGGLGALPRTPPKTFLEKSFWISKNFDVPKTAFSAKGYRKATKKLSLTVW
jgi:hypothetical protein